MLVVKTVSTNQAVIDVIEGETKAQGSAGTNTAGSPNFSDLTTGAFAFVLVGDSIYISGISSPFTVLTKVNNNNLVMSTNIASAHTANAKWKAKRGGIGISALQWPPVKDPMTDGKWHLYYNTTTFSV